MKNRNIIYLSLSLMLGMAQIQAINPNTINLRPASGTVGIGDFEQGQINPPYGEIGIGDFERDQIGGEVGIGDFEKNQLNRPSTLPALAPNSDLINVRPAVTVKNNTLTISTNKMYQQLLDIARALNNNVKSVSTKEVAPGKAVFATIEIPDYPGRSIVVAPNAQPSQAIGIGAFERLQQIKPISLQNQKQFDIFLKAAHRLNGNVVKRQAMGVSHGDITLATFANQRIVLQTM